ncbi:Adaptive-response sensory-kinase protein [Halorhabdus tiamatea SARL4B]|uniref:histidine kinase n=1 Tax=Halorhabdus tiamatea SARL4B TaxID=1033806 RepID=F7PG33_9EURY|nr:ATP-binding protein [Halorhabdus tiamatea]ERJ06303.1 Adaptive-response sensory-kinase protein [Halorhabdus tiamatea SARL4B]CCQ34643.1 multi-sensor signal transduction histidine kinase [Halorhabdus tiamatea SARL4B]
MGNPIRVLHVDDEPDFLDLVATMLESERDRFAVETATTASEALDRLDEDVDCLVSDYEMPGRDGLELLEVVRETYPNLPFILYTARGSESIASDAILSGVTDYLEKAGGTEQYTVLANRIENAVEQYWAERRAETLDRIRSTVRDVNQELVRSRSQAELESRVCEIITDGPPYEFAWIGEPDPDAGTVLPRASAGAGDSYLADISIALEEGPRARGPTARALAENELVVAQSIEEDDNFDPWREAARERGFAASAAVPLSFEDRQYGVLNVYSGEVAPFDETEKDLLRELGGDLGHAFHRLEQERQYRQLFEESINAIAVHEILTDEDGDPVDYVFLDANEAFEAATGLDRETIVGERATDVLADLDPTFVETYGEVALEGEPTAFEHHAASLGRRYSITAFPLGEGRFVTTFFDVTEQREHEQELAETNTLLSALLENLPFGVLVEGSDRKITAANPAFCAVFDVERSCEELLGSDCATTAENVAEQFADPQGFLDRIEEILGRREPVFAEELEMADGRTLSRSFVPFSLPDGEGNLWLYWDVTDRREHERDLEAMNDQLETIREQLELALETTNAYTFDWRPVESDIQRYPTFEDVFGIDSAAVKPVFDAFFEIVPPEHTDRVKATIQEAIDAGTGYDITYPVEPNEERIWVREQADVLTEGDSPRVVGTVTDVTELTEYERRLERQNERLDEFAEVISHDLRNPLNVAFGRAELLADECESAHIEPLVDALGRMEDIVGNTLTLARQGEAVGETEPVPVDSIVEECAKMIDAETATVEVSGEFRIRGDPDRIKHLFENLLSNAVDHAAGEASAAEGDVTVRIDQFDGRGFYVADDGAGIPADERADVFEPGYTTTTPGTGLGLTIVERIAEAHDWEVSVTESREGGARFEFTGVELD